MTRSALSPRATSRAPLSGQVVRWTCAKLEIALRIGSSIEPCAQLLQGALQAAVHGGHGHPLSGCDAPRRQTFEEPQQHGGPVGFLELQHGRNELLLRFGALQQRL